MTKAVTKQNKATHYTERELEAMSLKSGGRPDLTRDDVSRRKLDFFSRFHQEFDRELAHPADPKILEMADILGFERTMILQPFNAQVDIRSLGTGKTMLQLAAQTTSYESMHQMSVATFAIASARVLARVVKDRASNKFRVYILSEDPDMSRHVLVGVRTKGSQPLLIPTNVAGIASLPSTEPRDWSLSTVVVVTPVASFNLPHGLSGKAPLLGEELKASPKVAKDLITLEISSPPDDPVGRVMVVLESGSTIIKQCENHRVSFSLDEAKMMRELRLFP